MSLPGKVVADGETVEIPFEAYDQNGDKITNFVTLARNEQFNALTFNASQGKLKLSEKDDGTAKLEYIDDTDDDTDDTPWASSTATDGIDRVVSLTSIVVGGNNSTLMLNIQDKARPEGIKSVNIPSVVVERGTFDIEISGIIFVDQYGREMKTEDAEAFFDASKPALQDMVILNSMVTSS